ncbi:MAG: maleate cis-trans isomerase family protein [Xanthobacteraceae bacterium]
MMRRIGLIIPSSNRMVEQEMVRHLPPDFVAHIARLRMTGAHRVTIDELMPRVAEAAATLIDARCDVVAFHCTANSTGEGLAGETKLLAALKHAGAAQATTTATAIRYAFDILSVRRIVLLTPYSAHVTAEEAAFLAKAGYEVVHARGFALKGSDEYCATPPLFWRDRAVEAARPEADAYLLSCANISVFPVIAEIEQRLGRPVVTSNQAVIFHARSLLGATDRRNCPGRLFEALGTTVSTPGALVHP